MTTTSRATKRLTIVAIACAGPLWGCVGTTDAPAHALIGNASGTRIETTSETDDDAALAAVAGAGAWFAGGLIYDHISEQDGYRAGYAAGAGRSLPPPVPAPAVLPPAPLAPPPAPLPVPPPPPLP